ncbi:MAG: hypothetical protein JNK73_06330 [Bacteroidia bacterium]|nr:hypothetical protein [Bacteroidia bacterium]
MKITTKNYFKAIEEIGLEKLPPALRKSHALIEERTGKGSDWSVYEHDAEVKRVFDLSFEKLFEFIDRKEGLSGLDGNSVIDRAKKDAAGYKYLPLEKLKMIYRLEQDAELEDGLTEEIKIRKTALEKAIAEKEGTSVAKTSKAKSKFSEISQEVKFIHRFLDFHDKVLYKNTIGIFIDDLQKTITEKVITKKSPVAKEIMEMQDSALRAFNSMRNAKHFMLRPETIKKLKAIIEKYENSYEDIDESYAKAKKEKKNLNGLGSTPVNVMSSTDFTKLQFNTLGFTGKWLDFIGDPAPGFTAMVFGMPKMGKSYLCVDFAGYLARHHGKVLYVAKEEKLDATLQKKLKDKEVAHENLFVSDALPKDLAPYDFVFLDSVNKIGLTPKDLENLKANNKGKSFIYVFQATKGGKFKGNNEFQHDVDVVIEIPEQGKATQYGRFNQGGEMNIFVASEELSGVKQSEIEIEGELPVPFGELFIYVKRKGDKEEDIVSILDKEPERVIAEVKKIVNEIIKKKKLHITILDLEHAYNDSEKVDTGVAYFGIKLSGLKADLKKIAGEGKFIEYDWESSLAGGKRDKKNLDVQKNVSNVDSMKKKLKQEQDWTQRPELHPIERSHLIRIKNLYEAGDMKEAMRQAAFLDTFLREMIPPKMWVEMGGELTDNGKEKLKLSSDFANRPDDLNPKFIFSTTATALLIEALKGGFDLKHLIRQELANRGVDDNGNWVGFEKAKVIHKVKR